MGDIRVRAHVLKVLEEVVVTSVDSDRQRQCAFEAAICYAIGFGVPKDIQQSQRLLAQSGRLDLDLKRELEMLKTTPTSYRNSTIAAYHAEGTIFSPYISLLAEPRSVVNRIAQECKRELRDLEPYLGTQDSLFQHLQREYASLLLQLELHEEAERVWHDIVNTSKALFGPHNPTTITDMGNLAHTLGIQSKCDQAEKILTEALALSIMAPDLGPEHQVTLARRNELAFLMCQSGNYASAKKLHQEVLAARKRTLGDRHPEVLESRRGLLSAFDGLGESTGVVSQLEEVLDFHLRTLGPTHSETIKTRFQLAEALLASGAIERAEKETWMVLDLGAKYLDDHNITILHCRDVRAQVLLRLGHAEAAELLAEETLRLTRVSQGQMSNSTIIALDGLAQILAARGNLVAAEVHQREAVSYIKQSEQAESYNGLLFKHNLALTMDRLERYEEAEEFYREAYEGRLKKWGSAYPETMESKRCLLRVLELQGKQLEK
jgi:tetratricopeptide (TPR) repeat protein